MPWTVDIIPSAEKDLVKLGKSAQKKVFAYLESRIVEIADPRSFGKPLKHGLKGLWRYRVEDYRIVCQLEDKTSTVVVMGVGHRKDVYRE